MNEEPVSIRITRIDLPFGHCLVLMLKLIVAALLASLIIWGGCFLIGLLFGWSLFTAASGTLDPESLKLFISVCIGVAIACVILFLLQWAANRDRAKRARLIAEQTEEP